MKINPNFASMERNYLFAEVAAKTAAYQAAHPDQRLLHMGIGDVAGPLPQAVVEAMAAASREMGRKEGFRGYGPYEGYGFLREAISAYYADLGAQVDPAEIYVNDGAKSDAGNLGDLFDRDNLCLIPDPVYPVYVDANRMAGRPVAFLDATPENGFLPLPGPETRADLVYLCSPNNPTGAAYDRQGLQAWVDFANRTGAVLLYDAAYEAFITDPGLPRSIYQIPGAKSCAIELCTLSKLASFTGVRCGYTVFPKELRRDGQALGELWLRRQATKFNGVSYPVQRGAEAAFGKEGLAQARQAVKYYLENAAILAGAIGKFARYWGGKNSPYIWMECPKGMGSWEYFDFLLREKQIVATPGAGFGRNGEGFLRLTAFGSREDVLEAAERLGRG